MYQFRLAFLWLYQRVMSLSSKTACVLVLKSPLRQRRLCLRASNMLQPAPYSTLRFSCGFVLQDCPTGEYQQHH